MLGAVVRGQIVRETAQIPKRVKGGNAEARPFLYSRRAFTSGSLTHRYSLLFRYLGDIRFHMIDYSNPTIHSLCQRVADLLQATSLRLVTAESCTGGMIAAVCTDLAGSSQWFECGFVTYSNAAKQRDLGVSEVVIDTHGAVSQETVLAMTMGAARYGDVAVSVSGIAGPGGAVPGKPVGTVWIACGNQELQLSEVHYFEGNRQSVREQTVEAAFTLLIKYLDK